VTELGYAVSSEEHPPAELVGLARAAEDAGFTFALISDHFHPWTESPGRERLRLERQVGPGQDGFMGFYKREILGAFALRGGRARAGRG
jgi:alkanesulfonate monooxygenase SsuD/methylene tetrahydromethanopterin reductase-like flavin-dependent oxidoreductase (luciferase family)